MYRYILFIVIYLPVLTFLLLHPRISSNIMTVDVWSVLVMEADTFSCVVLLHFVAFLPLAFCFSQISSKKSILLWFVLLILYAIATEILQEYIPPRAFRYDDLTQDFAGIIVGLFFGYYLKHIRKEIDIYNDVFPKNSPLE
jgi:hypothetical protein